MTYCQSTFVITYLFFHPQTDSKDEDSDNEDNSEEDEIQAAMQNPFDLLNEDE